MNAPVIREQDILETPPPPQVGYWSEDEIRRYVESHGVDFGKTVACRGVKPNREWSNDRQFRGAPEPIESPVSEDSATIKSLKEQLDEMKAMLMEKTIEKVEPEKTATRVLMEKTLKVSAKGASRHTKPVLEEKKIDKRSREYRLQNGRSGPRKPPAGTPEGEL